MTVVNLREFRSRGKGTLTAVRELLVLAAKGQIDGLRFEARLKDGRRKSGATGTFGASDPADVPADLISLPVKQFKP